MMWAKVGNKITDVRVADSSIKMCLHILYNSRLLPAIKVEENPAKTAQWNVEGNNASISRIGQLIIT